MRTPIARLMVRVHPGEQWFTACIEAKHPGCRHPAGEALFDDLRHRVRGSQGRLVPATLPRTVGGRLHPDKSSHLGLGHARDTAPDLPQPVSPVPCRACLVLHHHVSVPRIRLRKTINRTVQMGTSTCDTPTDLGFVDLLSVRIHTLQASEALHTGDRRRR